MSIQLKRDILTKNIVISSINVDQDQTDIKITKKIIEDLINHAQVLPSNIHLCYGLNHQDNLAKGYFEDLTNQGIHLNKLLEEKEPSANKIQNVAIHILFGDSGILRGYKTDQATPHVWLNEARYNYITQEKEKSPLMRIHTLPNNTKSQDYLENLIKCMNEVSNEFHEYHKETLKIFKSDTKIEELDPTDFPKEGFCLIPLKLQSALRLDMEKKDGSPIERFNRITFKRVYPFLLGNQPQEYAMYKTSW